MVECMTVRELIEQLQGLGEEAQELDAYMEGDWGMDEVSVVYREEKPRIIRRVKIGERRLTIEERASLTARTGAWVPEVVDVVESVQDPPIKIVVIA
jgi:hypothetical protein